MLLNKILYWFNFTLAVLTGLGLVMTDNFWFLLSFVFAVCGALLNAKNLEELESMGDED